MKKSLRNILGVFVLMLTLLIPSNVRAEEMSDEFKSILNAENKIVIKDSILNNDKQHLVRNYLSKFVFDDGSWVDYNICNEDYSSCDLVINKPNGDGEAHTVSIEFKEEISEEFKKILTDGKLEITSTTFNDNSGLIYQTLSGKGTEKVRFGYEGCNEDYTICNVAMYDNLSSRPIETHAIKITYNEKFSKEFTKLLTDGVFKFKTIKPSGEEENEFMLWNYLDSFSTDDYYVGFSGCNEEYTKCEISIDGEIYERHVVNVTFEETNKTVKNKLNTYINKFESLKEEDADGWKSFKFDLIDLEMINYYATTKSTNFNFEKLSEMFNYSQTIKNIFAGLNFTYDYDCRMGSDEPFYSYAEGGLNIIYNNIYYGVVENIGTKAKNILYIPSDTEKTPEAFIAAAEKKIKDYMPNLNVKITKGLSFKDYEVDLGWAVIKDVTDTVKDLIDINKTVNNVFIVDFGGFKVDFLIVADSTKEVKTEFLTYDLDTNISIKSTSSSIPLDTSIEVEKLTSGTEYEKIIKILNVKENEMYDIKLFSNAKNEYITKLDNGKFEVKIPISKELEGKDLIVYYVDENNEVTPHEVTPENGYAIFETDHFSIYTLAEKKDKLTNEGVIVPNVKVPETSDGITAYIILGIISVAALSVIYLYAKKNRVCTK